jgi:hypothetical protein
MRPTPLRSWRLMGAGRTRCERSERFKQSSRTLPSADDSCANRAVFAAHPDVQCAARLTPRLADLRLDFRPLGSGAFQSNRLRAIAGVSIGHTAALTTPGTVGTKPVPVCPSVPLHHRNFSRGREFIRSGESCSGQGHGCLGLFLQCISSFTSLFYLI